MSGLPLGLTNENSICYANSFLQVVFHNKYFRNALYYTAPSPEEGSLKSELIKLFLQLQHSNGRSTSAHNLLNKADELDDSERFSPNHSQQQDVHEFATFLLSSIATQFEEEQRPRLFSDQQLNRLFQILSHEVSKCGGFCEEELKQPTLWSHFLQLTIGSGDAEKSIIDLITSYYTPTQVEYSCWCGGGLSTNTISTELPFVLNLLLQRYATEGKKINTKIEIPVDLDLSQFNSPSSKTSSSSTNDNIYNLAAVIVHEGTSLEKGHYKAYIRRNMSEKEWYECNDKTVKRVKDMDSVLKRIQDQVIIATYVRESNDMLQNLDEFIKDQVPKGEEWAKYIATIKKQSQPKKNTASRDSTTVDRPLRCSTNNNNNNNMGGVQKTVHSNPLPILPVNTHLSFGDFIPHTRLINVWGAPKQHLQHLDAEQQQSTEQPLEHELSEHELSEHKQSTQEQSEHHQCQYHQDGSISSDAKTDTVSDLTNTSSGQTESIVTNEVSNEEKPRNIALRVSKAKPAGNKPLTFEERKPPLEPKRVQAFEANAANLKPGKIRQLYEFQLIELDREQRSGDVVVYDLEDPSDYDHVYTLMRRDMILSSLFPNLEGSDWEYLTHRYFTDENNLTMIWLRPPNKEYPDGKYEGHFYSLGDKEPFTDLVIRQLSNCPRLLTQLYCLLLLHTVVMPHISFPFSHFNYVYTTVVFDNSRALGKRNQAQKEKQEMHTEQSDTLMQFYLQNSCIDFPLQLVKCISKAQTENQTEKQTQTQKQTQAKTVPQTVESVAQAVRTSFESIFDLTNDKNGGHLAAFYQNREVRYMILDFLGSLHPPSIIKKFNLNQSVAQEIENTIKEISTVYQYCFQKLYLRYQTQVSISTCTQNNKGNENRKRKRK
jgi:hypothetical protein